MVSACRPVRGAGRPWLEPPCNLMLSCCAAVTIKAQLPVMSFKRRLVLLTVLFAGVATSATLRGTAHGQQAPGACGYYRNSNGHDVPRPCGNWVANPAAPPNGATALCGDGTYSFSEHPFAGGTCSHHGGVVRHLH